MRKILLSIFVLALPAISSLRYGHQGAQTTVLKEQKHSATNTISVVYSVHNIMGLQTDYVTNNVGYVGDSIVQTVQGKSAASSNGVEHTYNGRIVNVTPMTNQLPLRVDRYRDWGYSNVLVVAVDWIAGMSDITTTGSTWGPLLGTSGVYTTESIQAAQLATSLWPGAQMLVLSSNCVDYEIEYWAYWYGIYSQYAFDRITPCDNADMPDVCGSNTAPRFVQWMSSFTWPITNYIAAHPEIHIVALSYGTPNRLRSTIGVSDTIPIEMMFFSYANGDTNGCYYGHQLSTNIQMFSFSCRTFEDTTNLLIRSSNFNIIHESASMVMDIKGGAGAFDGSIWPVNTATLTNYYEDDTKIVHHYQDAGYTISNIPIVLHWGWGIYTGPAYPDNSRRTVAAFLPVPNSISGSIESYSAISLGTFPDSSAKRHHHTRIYDCFSPTANFGTQSPTNIPLYSRTFGCAVGATREPYTTGVMTPEDFFPNMTKGYSFVECFYIMGAEHKMSVNHIVCGHPFMRITDFEVEGTTPWDESGVWPVPY